MRRNRLAADFAAVKACDAADYRQPQSGAAGVGRPRNVNPMEALEDARHLLGRDSASAVLDGKANALPVRRARHDDGWRPGMANGVLHEIAQGLRDESSVASHMDAARRS